MSFYGIDVSRFQGNIDWQEVKREGIQFAMLRAGFGAGNIDVQFRKNAEGCTRWGIPFGVYWFSYAYTSQMARKEAELCLETIEDFSVEYPVCIDFEEDSVRYAVSRGVQVTRDLATDIVDAFCKRTEQLGYYAMYYSNLDFLDRMFAPWLRDKYALWLARYGEMPDIGRVAMWQYSESGKISGVQGDVDLNRTWEDLGALIRDKGLNRLP